MWFVGSIGDMQGDVAERSSARRAAGERRVGGRHGHVVGEWRGNNFRPGGALGHLPRTGRPRGRRKRLGHACGNRPDAARCGKSPSANRIDSTICRSLSIEPIYSIGVESALGLGLLRPGVEKSTLHL